MDITKRAALVLLVLVSCVGCDQATKSAAQAVLAETGEWSFLGEMIRLQLTYNEGAFLGLGASLPEVWRQTLFIGATGVVLLGMLGYALFSKRSHPLPVLAVSLIVAGGASNLADRLVYDGRVVDFLNLGIGSMRTGVFNVADVFITAGVLVLVADPVIFKAKRH